MERSMQRSLSDLSRSLDESLPRQPNQTGSFSLTGNFAVVGAVLQRPGPFFQEIREGINIPQKIAGLFITSTIFLAVYGAVLGVGHPYLSLGAAIGLPLLFLGGLVACLPVMYLLDVLSGSQRSLGQTVAVILTATGMAATVFFSFAPIMMLFRLTGTILQYFWLNLGIVTMATLVGLVYVTQGLIQTTLVDTTHALSKLNRRLHFLWMLLYLMVITQLAWSMLSFFERTGGFLGLLF